MLITRVMPCLLLQDAALVKTIQFKNPAYVGDPCNAIRIYNEKEVDELVLLDISTRRNNTGPAIDLIERLASECFMPITYGGGIESIAIMRELFKRGVEKISLNTVAFENPHFVREASEEFGSQAIVASIDVMKRSDGYEVFIDAGKRSTGLDPRVWAENLVELGAGEILLTSIDRDGTQIGYDIELLKHVCPYVPVPVIACGGAGKVADFGDAVKLGGASAVAAGSMVVYFGRNRAVLINFPSKRELSRVLS
ncbi:MAG: AglZ/HisF2 family acetamidino modification protein [Planctomycetota bacterium]|jgi:cyclase